MKKTETLPQYLTPNQLMLFLDIVRGSQTQILWGTTENDFDKLKSWGLIEGEFADYRTGKDKCRTTNLGNGFVIAMQEMNPKKPVTVTHQLEVPVSDSVVIKSLKAQLFIAEEKNELMNRYFPSARLERETIKREIESISRLLQRITEPFTFV